MTTNFLNSTISLIEKQLHEEEVRYNEGSRMKAESDILKLIQQKIQALRAELRVQTEVTEQECNYIVDF